VCCCPVHGGQLCEQKCFQLTGGTLLCAPQDIRYHPQPPLRFDLGQTRAKTSEAHRGSPCASRAAIRASRSSSSRPLTAVSRITFAAATRALAALFGRQQKLYDAATLAFADDSDHDLSRLLGLMLWLAWDCGLDARKTDKTIFPTKEEERDRLEDRAKLLELAMRAANDEAALEEVRHSIWRTAAEAAKGAAHLWVIFHRAWGQALADLWAEHRSWRSLRRKPQSGDLGVAIKEADPKLRVVLGASNGNVHLAELGEHSGTVKFRSDFVAVAEMPSISF
jgi:hypothetical protein